MTDTMTIAAMTVATRGAAVRFRRLAGLALVALSPVLVACGGARGVFSGAPYTADIAPETVPRAEPAAPVVDSPAPAAQPSTSRPAPVEGVEEDAIEPPPGFEVTVEPPEEITEPLPGGPETPAEEAAPPISPRSDAAPPDQPDVAAASQETSLRRPPSPQTFPNLADVPDRPKDLPSAEERARALAELQADQAGAQPSGAAATPD